MYKSRFRKKILAWVTLLCIGGSTFQLGGCDQQIRDGVFAGLNSATNTLITALSDALFAALNNAGQSDDLTGGLTGEGDG